MIRRLGIGSAPVVPRAVCRALARLVLLAALLPPCAAGARDLWPEEAQRLRLGIELFPAVLGALVDLEQRATAERRLRVVVIGSGAKTAAARAASGLRELGAVRGLPLVVEVRPPESAQGSSAAAAFFVAVPGLPARQLRAWSEQGGVVVFSPFAGEVEKGAIAGLSVTDRILPHLNLRQARRAGLEFKPFFRRVAKVHD